MVGYYGPGRTATFKPQASCLTPDLEEAHMRATREEALSLRQSSPKHLSPGICDRQALRPQDTPGRGWLPGPGRQAGAAGVRGREGMVQPPVTTGWRLSLNVCPLPPGGLPGALSWEPGWPQLSPGPDKAATSALCEGKEAPADKEGKSPDSIGSAGPQLPWQPGSLQSRRQDAGGAVGRQWLCLSRFPG